MVTLAALAAIAAPAQLKPIPLFNGKDLTGWKADIPAHDNLTDPDPVFFVRDGVLVDLGRPAGQLLTTKEYGNYTLEVEYRFPEKAGNSGVLMHASTPRVVANVIPKCLEVQLMSGNAGDFWMMGETITQKGQAENHRGRRHKKLADGEELPIGQWNTMRILSNNGSVKVWVNGNMVNEGTDCTARKGKIGLQSEGVPIEFRKIELTPIVW